jgi:hypothetical protein
MRKIKFSFLSVYRRRESNRRLRWHKVRRAHIFNYVLPLCGEYICIKKHLTKNKIKLFTGLVTFVGHVIILMLNFPVDTLLVHTFTAAFLPSAPAAWAAASGAASGRIPGGRPSPVRLLTNSLKRAAAASARLTPLAPLVA